MLAMVQYEVYVLDEGRWVLHARYPGSERDHAMSDARRTEVNTGLPTKVVRDTYSPNDNFSEEVNAYVSPQAKQKGHRPQQSHG
jgi:adenylate cyclase